MGHWRPSRRAFYSRRRLASATLSVNTCASVAGDHRGRSTIETGRVHIAGGRSPGWVPRSYSGAGGRRRRLSRRNAIGLLWSGRPEVLSSHRGARRCSRDRGGPRNSSVRPNGSFSTQHYAYARCYRRNKGAQGREPNHGLKTRTRPKARPRPKTQTWAGAWVWL